MKSSHGKNWSFDVSKALNLRKLGKLGKFFNFLVPHVLPKLYMHHAFLMSIFSKNHLFL